MSELNYKRRYIPTHKILDGVLSCCGRHLPRLNVSSVAANIPIMISVKSLEPDVSISMISTVCRYKC